MITLTLCTIEVITDIQGGADYRTCRDSLAVHLCSEQVIVAITIVKDGGSRHTLKVPTLGKITGIASPEDAGAVWGIGVNRHIETVETTRELLSDPPKPINGTEIDEGVVDAEAIGRAALGSVHATRRAIRLRCLQS